MNNKDNTKLFWKYAASKRKRTDDLISLKVDGNKFITSDLGIAQKMNEYFSSMFTDEDLQSLPSFESVINNGELASITCPPPIGGFYVVIRTKAKQISGPRRNTPYDIEEMFSKTRTFVMRVI